MIKEKFWLQVWCCELELCISCVSGMLSGRVAERAAEGVGAVLWQICGSLQPALAFLFLVGAAARSEEAEEEGVAAGFVCKHVIISACLNS